MKHNSDKEQLIQQSLSWAKSILGTDFNISKEYGREDNQIHRLIWGRGSAFLKVGNNLRPEADRLQWLEGKIPAPKLLGFQTNVTTDFLLMSTIEGVNTCTLSTIVGIETVITKLAEVVLNLHKIDTSGCPFGVINEHNVLTHGDACLPNFIFQENGTFRGYIDLGDLAVAPREVDLAATIWSLEYNFGKGFGFQFLQKYGLPNPTEDLVSVLQQQYENKI